MTSPDNILVSGNLQGGGVGSVQIGSTPWAGSGYRMEIYGEEGTLVAVSVDSPQLQQVSIRGARGGSNELQDLTPAEELHLAPEIPAGSPYNVGQLYSQFAASIRGTTNGEAVPDFDHAVGLHKFIDAIRQSSDEGQRVAVA